jgi:hypothetical protein
VREPLLRFINDFGVRLAEISPHFIADARTCRPFCSSSISAAASTS